MTEQDKILLEDFKAKFRMLIKRQESLKTDKQQLIEQVELLKNEIVGLKSENEALIKKYDDLKVAKVLSVKDDENKLVKQRINKIVREIDKCIAQLNV